MDLLLFRSVVVSGFGLSLFFGGIYVLFRQWRDLCRFRLLSAGCSVCILLLVLPMLLAPYGWPLFLCWQAGLFLLFFSLWDLNRGLSAAKDAGDLEDWCGMAPVWPWVCIAVSLNSLFLYGMGF